MRKQGITNFDERITLRIKSKEMEITGQSIMGDSCEKMPIEYEGEEAQFLSTLNLFKIH